MTDSEKTFDLRRTSRCELRLPEIPNIELVDEEEYLYQIKLNTLDDLINLIRKSYEVYNTDEIVLGLNDINNFNSNSLCIEIYDDYRE